MALCDGAFYRILGVRWRNPLGDHGRCIHNHVCVWRLGFRQLD